MKSINSKSDIKSENNDDNLMITDSANKITKTAFHSTNNLIEIKKNSSRGVFDPKKLKTPILDSRKSKKRVSKKNPQKINKQLNIISKNILNTSKNINNPEEFYMNFFTNIIAKERSFNGDDNDKNSRNSKKSNNILNIYSGIKKESTYLRRKSSNLPKSLLDSFISNKDSKNI